MTMVSDDLKLIRATYCGDVIVAEDGGKRRDTGFNFD